MRKRVQAHRKDDLNLRRGAPWDFRQPLWDREELQWLWAGQTDNQVTFC